MEVEGRLIGFKLPARIDQVEAVLKETKRWSNTQELKDQAYRTGCSTPVISVQPSFTSASLSDSVQLIARPKAFVNFQCRVGVGQQPSLERTDVILNRL